MRKALEGPQTNDAVRLESAGSVFRADQVLRSDTHVDHFHDRRWPRLCVRPSISLAEYTCRGGVSKVSYGRRRNTTRFSAITPCRTCPRTDSGIGRPAITPAILIARSVAASTSVSTDASQYTCRYVAGHFSSSTQSETLGFLLTPFAFPRSAIVETKMSSPSIT